MRKNLITLQGEMKSNMVLERQNTYSAFVNVARMSGKVDTLKIEMPVEAIERKNNASIQKTFKKGEKVLIIGRIRTYNRGGHVEVVVYAEYIANGENTNPIETNEVLLIGNICKKTIHRKTPLGKDITNLFVAVNQTTTESNYIPCIAWSKTALLADKLQIGDKIILEGRMQSREYLKLHEDGSTESKTAYEVSVYRIKLIE